MKYNYKKQITEIVYVLIGDKHEENLPYIPPMEFWNKAISIVRECPFDIMQLTENRNYVETKRANHFYTPKDFRFTYSTNIKQYIDSQAKRNQFHLFILDTDSTLLDETISIISDEKNPLWFVCRANNSSYDFSRIKNYIQSSEEFISSIVANFGTFKELNPKVGIEVITPEPEGEFLPFTTYFSISLLNKAVIKDIFGAYISKEEKSLEEAEAEGLEQSKSALLNKDLFTRQNEVLTIIRIIDGYSFELVQDKTTPRPHFSDPIFQPLILIAPFNNPGAVNVFRISASAGGEFEKDFAAMLIGEQTNNYTNDVIIKHHPMALQAASKLVGHRIKYLDDVGYLHSTFTNSPILRLPLKGNSINRELSFFKPEFHAALSKSKNWKKIGKTIAKLGKSMSNKLLSTEAKTYIEERNGQLVAISDLPLEWMLIDGIPLGFSHDICRMPETAYSTLMAQFMSNSTMSFEVKPDIMKRTLIICGSDEPHFLAWQSLAKKLHEPMGYNFEICLSIEDVKKAYKKYNPDFVIYDCHGGIDQQNKQTYLRIGKEKLTGEVITKEFLTSPLVFISACGTAPTYGLYNLIANAFFEVGALSVTATYLPILVDSGATLYMRILNNLNQAAQSGIHSNWLAFISHMTRTAPIHVAYKGVDIYKGDEGRKMSEVLARSMFFKERRKLYHELDSIVKSAGAPNNNAFSNVVPEYLFYTNLGRGDLIYFSKWLELSQEKQSAQNVT